MTKGSLPARRACRDDGADLHLLIGHDRAVAKQCDKRPALVKREGRHGRRDALADVRDPSRERGHRLVRVRLRLPVTPLLRQASERVQDVLPLARAVVAPDDRGQGGVELALQRRQRRADGLLTRLQGLRPPRALVTAGQGVCQEGRVRQDLAEVGPHQVVAGVRRSDARRASLAAPSSQGVRAPAADVIGVAGRARAPPAGELAAAAAHHPTPQVLLGRVVAAGQPPVPLQRGLRRGAGLLAHDHRDGNRDPLLGRRRLVRVARSDRCKPCRPRRGSAPGPAWSRHSSAAALSAGGMRSALRRRAIPESVSASGGAVSQAKICAPTVALPVSMPTRRGARGRGGAGARGVQDRAVGRAGRVQGRRRPPRSVACRPRRLRSAISGRSYSAPAPRIWSTRWSGGSSPIGRSRTVTGRGAPQGREVVQQQHLGDVGARHAVGRGHQHALACG